MKVSTINQLAFVLLCLACFLFILVQDLVHWSRKQTTSTSSAALGPARMRAQKQPQQQEKKQQEARQVQGAGEAQEEIQAGPALRAPEAAGEKGGKFLESPESGGLGRPPRSGGELREKEKETNPVEWPPPPPSETRAREKQLFRPSKVVSNKVIDKLSETIYRKMLWEPVKVGGPGGTLEWPRRLLELTNLTYPIEPDQQLLECSLFGGQEKGRQEREKAAKNEPASLLNRKGHLFSRQQEREREGGRRRRHLVVVVNSSWQNFERRRLLRESWLNKASIVDSICRQESEERPNEATGDMQSAKIRWQVSYVFALGSGTAMGMGMAEAANGSGSISAIHALVQEESRRHGDLLVMNLHERYRAMSLKHLSIFKWLLQARLTRARPKAPKGAASIDDDDDEEEQSTLILKCDDDAHLDLGQWLQLYASGAWWLVSSEVSPGSSAASTIGAARAEPSFGSTAGNWIMCARFPVNMRVSRASQSHSKWRLTRAEYQFDTFPAYCSGLAYLAPLELLRRLLVLAHVLLWHEASGEYKSPLWVDDVFVTGVLAASLQDQVEVLRLNAHFCYTRAQRSRRAKLRTPCMVSEMEQR